MKLLVLSNIIAKDQFSLSTECLMKLALVILVYSISLYLFIPTNKSNNN